MTANIWLKTTRGLWLVLAFAMAVFAGPARAQDEDGIDPDDPYANMESYWSGDYTRYRPDVSRSDVTFFARMARLSPEQREAALELHGSYAQRYEAAAKKMQEYEDSLTGGDQNRLYGDEKIEETLKPVREEFHKHEKKLKDELIADMKTVLTEEQQGRWEWFERRADWNSVLWNFGLEPNGYPDLALIVHRVAGAESVSDEVMDAIARFYADTFALKKDYDDWSSRRRAAVIANAGQQEINVEEAEGVEGAEAANDVEADAAVVPDFAEAERIEFRRKGLEILQRAASKIQGLLPPAQAERFEEKYLTQMTSGMDMWGFWGRPERAFDKALKVKALAAEQRTQLETIQAEVRAQSIARMRSTLAERLKKPLGGDARDDGDQMAMMMKFQQMMVSQKAMMSKIRGVLSEAQQAEAGPPVAKSTLRVPDFDAEDEPAPEMKERPAGMPDMQEALSAPAVNDLDLAFLKRAAPLTDDQHLAAKDLFAAYTSRSRNASKKMAAYQQAMSERMMQGETPDFLDKQQMRMHLKYEQYTKRIKDELLADARELLTEEQSAAYDALKRRVNRKLLARNEIPVDAIGARVDLVSVAEGAMGQDEMPDEARAVLDRYETDLAPAIDRLAAFEEQELKRARKMAEGGGAVDMGDLMGFFNNAESQAQKMMIEVRDLNLKCFKELTPKMPEARRAEFEESFYSIADPTTPWYYMAGGGGGSPRGLLDEALALDDLTEEQTATLRAAVRAYATQALEVRREGFELQLASEKPGQKSFERMKDLDYTKIHERQETLRKSSVRTVGEMLGALTDEQRGRLPKAYRPALTVERPRFEEE